MECQFISDIQKDNFFSVNISNLFMQPFQGSIRFSDLLLKILRMIESSEHH